MAFLTIPAATTSSPTATNTLPILKSGRGWSMRDTSTNPEKFASFVVTATENDLMDEPIAIGVWDIAVGTKAKGGGNHCLLMPNFHACLLTQWRC
jgi:hypothetical protein